MASGHSARKPKPATSAEDDPAPSARRIASALRDVRLRNGTTVAELARLSGVRETNIHRYESGERTPDFDTVAQLEKAMKVPLGTVLRLAGYVEGSEIEVVDAILADPTLDEATRAVLLAAYDAAARQSRSEEATRPAR